MMWDWLTVGTGVIAVTFSIVAFGFSVGIWYYRVTRPESVERKQP